VRSEIKAYGYGVAEKREIVALNKIDALTPEQLKMQKERLARAMKNSPRSAAQPFPISAATGAGMRELLRAILNVIDQERGTGRKPAEAEVWHP
jgi:GTP-binding protein